MRKAVTLIEVLFVLAILIVLAAVGMGFYAGAVAQARVHRTRAIVTKLDSFVMEKWESYRTRAVPIKIPAGTSPIQAGRTRLYALRELMRVEMPDRKSDVTTNPALVTMPALQRNYQRRAAATWTEQHEGAECLYLIIAAMRDGDDAALAAFSPSEIGDTDGDGMQEFQDGWGQPIEFLRWASGYVIENGPVTPQTSDFAKAPDPFDPLHTDPRWTDADLKFAPYYLLPLIFSAGPDKQYDINTGTVTYASTTPPNDPYQAVTPAVGTPLDFDGDGPGHADNITSHD